MFLSDISFDNNFITSPATPDPPMPIINKLSYETFSRLLEYSRSDII